MGLKGTFKSMPAADLLQWLSLSRKSGALMVENLPHKITFSLKDGGVLWSSSDGPNSFMGEFLVREGFIKKTDLASALQLQSSTGISTGKALVALGAIAERTLSDAMRLKAQAEIHETLSSPNAQFEFLDEGIESKELVPLDANVVTLLLNVMRQIDEDTRGSSWLDEGDDIVC